MDVGIDVDFVGIDVFVLKCDMRCFGCGVEGVANDEENEFV